MSWPSAGSRRRSPFRGWSSGRARRPRRAGTVADRVGQDARVRVPLVELLRDSDARPSALVLAPTRELAIQIVDDLRPIAHARALSIAPVYGGAGIVKQARIAARAHILVATPGPPARPDRASRRVARSRADARARRGRQDARHGLSPGGRQDREDDLEQAPDAALLGDARGRGRTDRQGVHLRTRVATSTRTRRNAREMSSIAS